MRVELHLDWVKAYIGIQRDSRGGEIAKSGCLVWDPSLVTAEGVHVL